MTVGFQPTVIDFADFRHGTLRLDFGTNQDKKRCLKIILKSYKKGLTKRRKSGIIALL